MGVAPLAQFTQKSATIPGYIYISDETYFKVNCLIFLTLVLFEAVYKVCTLWTSQITSPPNIQEHLSGRSIVLMLLIDIIIAVYSLHKNSFDITKLILRVENQDLLVGDPLFYIYGNMVLVLPAVFILYILLFKKNSFLICIFSFFLLLTRFPLAISRFNIALIYIPILTVFFYKFLFRHKHFFQIFFALSIFIVFPILNFFRDDDFDYIITRLKEFDLLKFDYLLGMQFDSFQSFCFVVDNDIVTYGQQILGVLFFWIPRSLWETKPIFSGAYIAKNYKLFNTDFSNIALNYWGEGFINFGFVGVILFTLILALIFFYMDFHFWCTCKGNIASSFFVIYILFISSLFFLLRGSLMNALPVTCGAIITAYISRYFLSRQKSKGDSKL